MKEEVRKKLIIIIIVLIVFVSGYLLFIGKNKEKMESKNKNIASSNTKLSLECASASLSPGTSFDCALHISTSENISSVKAKLKAGANLTVVSVTPSDGWWGDKDDSDIAYITDENKTGNFVLATFKVKAAAINTGLTTTISIDDINLYNDNFTKVILDSDALTKNIRIPSTINTIKDLTVSGTEFNFNSSTTTYNITSKSSVVTISATPTSSTSVVTGTGSKSLNYGVNTFKIDVKSETGQQKTYTLNITRKDERSANNNLSSLSVSGANINFNSSTINYNVIVPATTTSVDIKATLDDQKSKFVSGYGPRKVSLTSGNNNIEIKVQAENESIKVYTINVSKEVKIEDISDYKKIGKYVELYASTDVNKIKLNENYSYKIRSSANKYKSSGKIVTVDIIEIYSGAVKLFEDTLIIKGDLNSDGIVNIADVSKLYQYFKKKITMGDIYIKTGDVVNNNVSDIDIGDVSKLYQYVKGKINSLK